MIKLLLPLLLLQTTYIYAQIDNTKRNHILAVPILAKAKETGWAYGFAGVSTFSLSKKDTISKCSQVYAAAVYTTQKQLFIGTMGKLYFGKNNYILEGEVSYRDYPEKFWGLGNKAPDSAMEIYRFRQHYLFVHLMKQVKRNFYVGVRAQMQNIAKITYEDGGVFDQQNVRGRRPYKTVGIGASITYDSRNDAFASTRGTFLQLQFQNFNSAIGSDFQFNSILLDYRKYCTVFRNKVFAIQAHYLLNNGGHVPLRSLALFGGSNSIRGFYRGRYRGKQDYYFQSEYRMPLYKRLGAVAFSGVGDVGNDFSDYTFRSLKYSVGGGLRFAINKSNRLNIRLDFALGKDGNKGLYLDVGEAF